jgi:hypothetical protein
MFKMPWKGSICERGRSSTIKEKTVLSTQGHQLTKPYKDWRQWTEPHQTASAMEEDTQSPSFFFWWSVRSILRMSQFLPFLSGILTVGVIYHFSERRIHQDMDTATRLLQESARFEEVCLLYNMSTLLVYGSVTEISQTTKQLDRNVSAKVERICLLDIPSFNWQLLRIKLHFESICNGVGIVQRSRKQGKRPNLTKLSQIDLSLFFK